MTNIENEKIIPPPLKLMIKNEVMNDLLKLLDLVQKHADKQGCQHCLDLLESVFDTKISILSVISVRRPNLFRVQRNNSKRNNLKQTLYFSRLL